MSSLPNNIEAEELVIACAMMDADCIARAGLRPEAMYHPLHRFAWDAAARLAERQQPVDAITIADAAEGLNDPARSELRVHLSGLAVRHTCAVTDIVEHYAEAVRKAWVTRQVALICGRAGELIQRGEGGAELVTRLLGELGSIEGEEASTGVSMARLIKDCAREIFENMNSTAPTGYPTGVENLDGLLGGLQPGIVTIVAARPGMGKSSFAMSVAEACSKAGHGVHVFSIEDRWSAYGHRIIARNAGVPVEAIRTCHLRKDYWERTSRAMRALSMSTVKWHIDSRSEISHTELIRAVRKHRRDLDTRVVIVDYIQLLRRSGGGLKKHDEIDEQITALSAAAKRDDMAYLVLSQLNRGLEGRDDKVPRLSDLKESGALEERAKCVIGLHRPSKYDDRAPESELQIHVLKNNHGRTGCVEAIWDGPTTTIR